MELPAAELPVLDQHEIDRRTLLRAGLVAAGAAALPEIPSTIRWTADQAGDFYDSLASPEDVIGRPVPVLEPRRDDEPTVTPGEHGPDIQVSTRFTRAKDQAQLRLQSDLPLFAEHTRTPVVANSFLAAGTGIITTAEGPLAGEQTYCSFFTSSDPKQQLNQTIAVSPKGGLYVYEPDLAQRDGGTSGEWVRVMARIDQSPLASPVHSHNAWADYEAAQPKRLLIQDVIAGTETLQKLGYKPWAAVLPTTETPFMLTPENLIPGISPETCIQNTTELAGIQENGKHYMVSERGDIIDLTHLFAKAGETLNLYAQLYYQHVADEQHPTARVKYAAGSSSTFDYTVSSESLHPDNLIDTTFAIMTTTSIAMEGVSQRLLIETMPGGKALSDEWPSGLSPEDLTTNSMGIIGMLELITKYNLGQRLDGPLRQLQRNNPAMNTREMNEALDVVLAEVRPQLELAVAERTAQHIGIRRIAEPVRTALPRGLYPLIPVKLQPEDAATPTHINLHGAGIRTENPQVQFTLQHVPAMKPTLHHILGKAGI